ncbi:OprD family porin [Pseudomonas sp. CC6-YY-74]|nr:OprD family porin [Pseudomonas sp. CC6-YY-74]
MNVRARHQRLRLVSTVSTRSNVGSELDENRFIVSYSLPLW